MKKVFPPEWRTQSRWKRRFYAKYMRTLERAGYLLVIAVFAAFIFAFNYRVDDLVTADKVPVLPFSTPLAAKGPCLVVRALSNDLAAVKKGQPLLEIVEGEETIRRYGDWKAVDELSKRVRSAGEIKELLVAYPKPPTLVVVAPMDGVFRLDAKEGLPVDDKATLGRVVDYNDLRLSASLAGETVAQAQVGQPARISSIVVEPEAGTLFRGTDAISGRLLQDRVKVALDSRLVGRRVRLRDDVALQVNEISEVQVDASTVRTSGGDPTQAVLLDPPGDFQAEAEVIEGRPSATVQIADLPPALETEVRDIVRTALRGRSVRGIDGTIATLQDAKDVRMVVKLKAGPSTQPDASPIPGAMLSRTFDAQLKVKNPPPFLVEAVREADRAGKAVTARVELRSGSRPIALRLLKKS